MKSFIVAAVCVALLAALRVTATDSSAPATDAVALVSVTLEGVRFLQSDLRVTGKRELADPNLWEMPPLLLTGCGNMNGPDPIRPGYVCANNPDPECKVRCKGHVPGFLVGGCGNLVGPLNLALGGVCNVFTEAPEGYGDSCEAGCADYIASDAWRADETGETLFHFEGATPEAEARLAAARAARDERAARAVKIAELEAQLAELRGSAATA